MRRVTRDAQRARHERDVAIARLDDAAGLAAVMHGARGAFVLLPDDLQATAFHVERRRMADAIAQAIREAAVPRVVLLSSTVAALGAGEGHGFGADLAYFERVVAETGVRLTILRAPYFQENVLQALPAAARDGIFPSLFRARTSPLATIATSDVGAIAARAILSMSARSEIVDLVGPTYTPSDMASALGVALGKSLALIDVAAREEMLGQWMSAEAARAMVETIDCIGSGMVELRGDRRERGTRRLAEMLRATLAPRPAVEVAA